MKIDDIGIGRADAPRSGEADPDMAEQKRRDTNEDEGR